MRAYQVQVKGVTRGYAGSMAECRATKAKFVEEGIAAKASDVTYEEVEIGTGKGPILELLNKTIAESFEAAGK